MFTVCFMLDAEYDKYDKLESFDTLEEAQAYRADQLEIEGWDDEPGTESDQYVIKEV